MLCFVQIRARGRARSHSESAAQPGSAPRDTGPSLPSAYHRLTMTARSAPEPATAARETLPLEAALDRVGDRWSLLVVEALLDGPRRFGELGDALPGIAPNILTDRLRRLE